MGPAGVEYVYKDELKKIRAGRSAQLDAETKARISSGLPEEQASAEAEAAVDTAIKAEEALLAQRYEREIMNPEEALSLGSISEIVMPADLRKTLATQMAFCLRHYTPGPMQAVQREFH
jgi:acetyl-CoA carboxylase carboxyltransferase component